jgi:GMC oxidoreductase
MWAAGAKQVVQESRFAHLVGAARMGSDPSTSVVDKFGRTHDIPNLFICDGSILPTQGSANPGLTIQALASRTADYLIKQDDAVFFSSHRDQNEPGMTLVRHTRNLRAIRVSPNPRAVSVRRRRRLPGQHQSRTCRDVSILLLPG